MNVNGKRALAACLALAIGFISTFGAAAMEQACDNVFFDDFNGSQLDTDKWLIACKNWGGKDAGGRDYNGGVVPENVSVSDGTLKLEGHGNNYTGGVMGVNKDGSPRADGKRVGAAIATKAYFASGSYEVVAKVAPQLGACSAIWTFEYEEYYPGDPQYVKMPVGGNDYYAVNHEIDIEMPGRPSAGNTGQSFSYALCNTWTGENNSEYTCNYTDLGTAQDDGQFHTYRFDWHTGDTGESARVEFYFDGVLTHTSTTHIPTNAGRLWLGLWFPKEWAGTPDFDTTVFEIDSVRITPFHESGDRPQAETFPNDGWYIPPATGELPAPVVSGTLSENTATLRWAPVDGADGYELLQNGTVVSNVTSPCEIGALPPGNHVFQVRARKGLQAGAWSEIISLTVIDSDPAEPSGNLLVNGDFSEGETGWMLSGGTIITAGEAILASGSDTDTLTQTITVSPDTTYTLSMDLHSSGAQLDFGVRDYDGKYSERKASSTGSGRAALTFTTGAHTRQITVFSEVLRYQENKQPVMADNIVLSSGSVRPEPEEPAIPATPGGLTAEASGAAAVTVSWQQSPNAESYDLKINDTIVTGVESGYVHTGISQGKTYTYAVRAVNQAGVSDWSAPVTAAVETPAPMENLIRNGDFSNGTAGWTLIGGAGVSGGKALLASGRDTDILQQTVSVIPGTTYVFSADILTNGAVVDQGVMDYNGRYSETTLAFAESVRGTLQFTTGPNTQSVTLFVRVLRYQADSSTVLADNLSLQIL